MRLEKVGLICLLLFLISTLAAQPIDFITKSSNYYYGVGESENLNEARQQALNEMVTSIQVYIASEFITQRVETKEAVDEFVQLIQKSSSIIQLSNVQEKREKRKKIYHVVKYVEKEEVSKFFEKNKNKIKEYLKYATRYEEESDLLGALKNYFRAYLLSKTYPDTIQLHIPDIPLQTEFPSLAIGNKIDQIIRDINITINRCETENEALIAHAAVQYKHNPVKRLALTYYNGFGEETSYIDDGETEMVFEVKPIDTELPISMHIEYAFERDIVKDQYLNLIYQNSSPQFFDNTKQTKLDLMPFIQVDFQVDFKDDIVQFNHQLKTIAPKSFHWDFGDGSISTNQSPIHKYESIGIYTVTLKLNENEKLICRKKINLENKTVSELSDVKQDKENKPDITYSNDENMKDLNQEDSELFEEFISIEDTKNLLQYLEKSYTLGYLVYGKKDTFRNLDGLYVAVVDQNNVSGIFQYINSRYVDQKSNEIFEDLSHFHGKFTIWVMFFNLKK